jgi:hypothetical protein
MNRNIIPLLILFVTCSAYPYKSDPVQLSQNDHRPTLAANSASSCSLAIGQTYQGGIIFYLDCTGCHGLIAAPTDQGSGTPWNNGTFAHTTAFANGVGAGLGNSKLIVLNQGTGTYAAKLCTDLTIDGNNDWYLPSRYELNLMYMNIGPGAAAPYTNIGGFTATHYWSSTEVDSNNAWYQLFLLGGQFTGAKNTGYKVRAIRAF